MGLSECVYECLWFGGWLKDCLFGCGCRCGYVIGCVWICWFVSVGVYESEGMAVRVSGYGHGGCAWGV